MADNRKQGAAKNRATPGVCRVKSMHRRKAALKFRATSFSPATPEQQPKARRGEKPGSAKANAATYL